MFRDILTVSALNENIRHLLESSFDLLLVEGEISNLRRPASGHLYFTLKDEKSQIRAVIFRSPFGQKPGFGSIGSQGFDLEEGMSVICRARLSVYHPRGEYQLIVNAVELKGLGALQKAFEQLKARLEAEGIFDPARKKPVPFLPDRIGVITSPTGAAIRDILNITGRRFSSADIMIAPVRVQGAEAPGEIAAAIANMHSIGDIDVIILARGGGSLEDLAPFNDERVARAIHRSRIPIISAVGHETDFTIADFAADLRAPTPSAAAELVVPVKAELVTFIESLSRRMIAHQDRILERLRGQVSDRIGRLKDPGRRIADLFITLDDHCDRIKSDLENNLTVQGHRERNLNIRLIHAAPLSRIRDYRFVLENLHRNMIAELRNTIEGLKKKVQSNMAILDTLSPLAVLKRGYSIVKSLPAGIVVRRADAVAVGSSLDVRVSQGGFHARVTRVYEERKGDGEGKI
ncbi:MAG: exodeoxyribonuclease VII large subunit [Syntrophales bacterium]|nr:exodeoxyribonuclease VII large subunit [Syntrophales bacterium]